MQTFSSYTLTALLHEGAYTTLYRGFAADGTPVVVKLLKSEYPTPEAIARIQHEYRILRDLDAPGVVKAYALESSGPSFALILEDFGGQALDKILAQQRLDTSIVLSTAIAIADALSSIHARRIIHKDIKPSNILVDLETQKPQLIDFGIATRLFQEASQARHRDAFEGTLAYMSPEQTGLTNRVVDSRTDLYSLGVTLYEALAGSRPFPTTDLMDLVHSHLARMPPPPREHAPDIPEPLSDIVMKLLAKDPEDRYQSASGLKADLEQCLSHLSAAGSVAAFPLAQRDSIRRLRIPQRLYGREEQVAVLLEAFERSVAGSAEILLVSGYSGIGKSALVKEIYRAIARHTGYFGAGKFDQLARDMPYSGVASALGDFVHQLLMEDDSALDRWRRAILAAVRSNGKVLTDVIPVLELVLGEQADVPELPPVAAQNRFTFVFQDFFSVFARAKRPLVLFLEDLQWADLASLKLLELLMTGPERGCLLVIGTYRSNEVDAAHPLHRTLRAIAGSAAVNRIELGPLGHEDVCRFIADALGDDPQRVEPLADVVFEKTRGNPFFVMQFLNAIHRDELLTWEEEAGVSRWDLTQIRARMATDNVVDFMVSRLKRLPSRTQRALSLAACIGHQFALHTLAMVSDATPAAVAAELWRALEEGVLSPVGDEYRFFDDPHHPPPGDIEVSYRFVHDRVQQAAYSLIDEGERAAAHLRIGRLLLASQDSASPGVLFEIVSHLNLGAGLITDRRERLTLARLNLEAGKRARVATAYEVAASYLARGADLLDEASWEDAYDLAFALHAERAQCEAQAGAHGVVESLQEVLLARAKTDVERAQVLERRLNLYSAQGRHRDAIAAGLAALRLLGVEGYDAEEQWSAALDAEMAAVQVNLAGRRLEDLVDASVMTGSRPRAAMTILMSMASPALGYSQPLHHWIAAKAVNLSLVHGNTDASPRAYALYGVVLSVFMVRPDEGYAFGKLALALHEKLGIRDGTAMFSTLFISAAFYSAHYRTLIPYLERGTQAGLESGEFLFLSYCRSHIAIFMVALGEPLSALREELARSLALVQRTKVGSTGAILTCARQVVEALEGRTRSREALSDATFDEAAFAANVERGGFMVALCWYWTVKGELLFLYEDYEGALAVLLRARSGVSLGFEPDMRYYLGLSILALLPSASAEERRRLEPILSSCMDDIALYARSCAANFLQKHLLLQAEQARVAGEALRAMELYDQAISAARDNDWVRDIALTNELAARFFVGLGRSRIARGYMLEAHYYYLRWGATAKASHLVERYPEMMLNAPARSSATDVGRTLTTTTTTTTPTTTTQSGRAVQFDVAALVRAAQTIAGEIVLDKLLSRLMQVVVENAGAERGALLLEQERSGQLAIAATVYPGGEAVIPSPRAPIEAEAWLSVAVVQFVARTQKSVVLHNASREGAFLHDPQIQSQGSKSVLCMPVLQQGAVRGVLYLENNLTTGAFTEERVELLRVLSGQMATSIENASLYGNLEQKVIERTRQLEEAQGRLVKLEKAALEVRMAGGFAHEMRNALSAAKLVLRAAYPAPNESLCTANSSALVGLLAQLRTQLPMEALEEAAPVLRKMIKDEERLDSILRRVGGSIDRALRVTSTILEYSRLGSEKPGTEPVAMRPLAESILAELAKDLSEHGITATVDIAASRTLPGREAHFATIVRNLLQNARAAIVEQVGDGPRAIHIGEAEEPGRWVLRISDTGAGIAPGDRDHIFEPFFSTRPATGLGLGLGIVEKLVSLYGGAIAFESDVNRGTTFTIAFPAPGGDPLEAPPRARGAAEA